jgi:D-alanine-D-alanine ligase
LESVGIPYTGSGVLASALAMDKVQSKRLFEIANIPTAEWCYPATEEAVLQLGLPVVIKPRREGSSVGVTIVHQRDQLAPALSQAGGPRSALAERYIVGREIEVAVLGFEDDARCLGSVEVRPAEGYYDYEAKYKRDDTQYLVPAPVPEETQRQLEAKTIEVHRLLGCAGATRTDFIWDETNPPLILELNTIPGMTSHSLLPMIARHAGLSYEDLAEAMLLDADLRA